MPRRQLATIPKTLKSINRQSLKFNGYLFIFLSVISLPYGEPWATDRETALLTRCQFTVSVTRLNLKPRPSTSARFKQLIDEIRWNLSRKPSNSESDAQSHCAILPILMTRVTWLRKLCTFSRPKILALAINFICNGILLIKTKPSKTVFSIRSKNISIFLKNLLSNV